MSFLDTSFTAEVTEVAKNRQSNRFGLLRESNSSENGKKKNKKKHPFAFLLLYGENKMF